MRALEEVMEGKKHQEEDEKCSVFQLSVIQEVDVLLYINKASKRSAADCLITQVDAEKFWNL